MQGWSARRMVLGAVVLLLILGSTVLTAAVPLVPPDVAAPRATHFLAVFKTQANTDFALTIRDRNERVMWVFTTLTRHALDSQRDLRATLDAANIPYRPYYLVNAIAMKGDTALQEQIKARPEIAYVLELPYMDNLPNEPATPNVMLEPQEVVPDHVAGTPSWGIEYIQAPRVWTELGVTGRGIRVGSADTGVDWTHPDLAPNYLGREGSHTYSWFDPWFATPTPRDWQGHGTHTTGTMVGQNGIGVAPGAEWMGCVSLGRNWGNAGYYIDCMQFLFAPFPQGASPFSGNPIWGAHIVNNSWGCPVEERCNDTILLVAMGHLADAGQLNVVAAGNSGPACASIGNPSFGERVLSIGALSEQGKITSFSSRGPVLIDGSRRVKPDLMAPGSGITSAFPGGKYSRAMGTSMAAPHVAGVVALIWSARPELVGKLEETRQILVSTAQALTPEGTPCGGTEGIPNNHYGYGSVNAFAAVKAAQTWR